MPNFPQTPEDMQILVLAVSLATGLVAAFLLTDYL